MNRCRIMLVCALAWTYIGCGGDDAALSQLHVKPIQRNKAVWLEAPNLSEGFALRLQRAGVDEVVVPCGSVSFSDGAPVLRLTRTWEISNALPVSVALVVEGLSADVGKSEVESMWQALSKELSRVRPAGVIVTITDLSENAASFIELLAGVSGRPVTPLITIEQMRTEAGLAAAAAAGVCVVPAFGVEGSGLDGVDEMASLTLVERLAPLGEAGIKVRVAISLRPQTEPVIPQWGESLDVLCNLEVAEMSRTSKFDRTFVFSRAASWSGRNWNEGQAVAIKWIDAARLNLFMQESSRLITPELAGWDIVSAGKPSSVLGIGRDAVVEYLSGRGPGPELEIEARRQGRDLTITLTNGSPFTSAVSSFANWLEVSVASGSIVVRDKGDFDRVILGTRRNGEWQPLNSTSVDAARFEETYIDAREALRTGRIRLPSSRTDAIVRWNSILTTGEEISETRLIR